MGAFFIIAAALAALTFLVGGLWYSPVLFLNPWLKELSSWAKEAGRFQVTSMKPHSPWVFVWSYALSFVAALGLIFLMKDGAHALTGPAGRAVLGLLVGTCFAGSSIGINFLFSGKPTKLIFIDAGYHVVQFTLMGLVLGFWY